MDMQVSSSFFVLFNTMLLIMAFFFRYLSISGRCPLLGFDQGILQDSGRLDMLYNDGMTGYLQMFW